MCGKIFCVICVCCVSICDCVVCHCVRWVCACGVEQRLKESSESGTVNHQMTTRICSCTEKMSLLTPGWILLGSHPPGSQKRGVLIDGKAECGFC